MPRKWRYRGVVLSVPQWISMTQSKKEKLKGDSSSNTADICPVNNEWYGASESSFKLDYNISDSLRAMKLLLDAF